MTYEVRGYEVTIGRTKYTYNNSLAVSLETTSLEPFAVITVCIDISDTCKKDCAFVDVNNCPWAEKFLTENKLAEPTGRIGYSGFCSYPEYKFNLELIPKLK
ncbi:MAG: DUF4313 domain-containing protein [Bacilli bacterium]|jgi:hypothetical protein